MHVWIFVLSAMFSPVVEPLGISLDPPQTEMTFVVVDEPEAPVPMRYRGIEQLFDQLDTNPIDAE